LFDDWVVANFLDSRPPALPPYAYTDIHVLAEPLLLKGALPVVGAGRVDNYGAVYLDLPSLEVDSTVSVRAVVDGDDGAPLRAALISWDSRGLMQPTVSPVSLAPTTAGGAVAGPPGYDRHTLAIWSRGVEGEAASFGFRYSLAADPPGGVQFLDVGSDHQFFSYIVDLAERGVVNGKETPVGSGLWYFRPDDPVLRAQFAQMIVEATRLHTPEVENLTTPTFRDVRPTFGGQGDPLPYPFDYVEEAAAAGIVGGYGDGGFHPWEPIKRIQLVRMILRGAAAAGHPLPAYTGSEAVFADVHPGNPLYQDTMIAYQSGIMNGATGPDGRLYFYPWSSATRGQVAKMTSNLLQLLGF
jgi:S-layer homology domain